MNKINQAIAALKADPSWSTNELAEYLDISLQTARKARNSISGHSRLPREWTKVQDEKILKLRSENMSFRLIGIELDIGVTSIRKRYHELNRGVKAIEDQTALTWTYGTWVRYIPVFGR